jgi:hypothetical protein
MVFAAASVLDKALCPLLIANVTSNLSPDEATEKESSEYEPSLVVPFFLSPSRFRFLFFLLEKSENHRSSPACEAVVMTVVGRRPVPQSAIPVARFALALQIPFFSVALLFSQTYRPET